MFGTSEEVLRRLAEWSCVNSLLINADKKKFILFGELQPLARMPSLPVSFLGQDLTPEPFVKDLGMILDCYLSFNQHIITLMSSLLGSLCRINNYIESVTSH